MEQSIYHYCQLSGRLGNRTPLVSTAPTDAPPRHFDVTGGVQRLETLASETLLAYNHYRGQSLQLGGEIVGASDACFASFQLKGGDTSWSFAISRISFTPAEIATFWSELTEATGCHLESGLEFASVEQKHVVAILRYTPSYSQEPFHFESAKIQKIALKKIHDRGLVHGGINERFINPSILQPEPFPDYLLYGVGLAGVYAQWRRKHCKLRLGLMVADPRFASPSMLAGEPPSPAADNFALEVLSAAVKKPRTGTARHLWTMPINGPDALMQRARVVAEMNLELLPGSREVAGESPVRSVDIQEDQVPVTPAWPRWVSGVTAGLLLLAIIAAPYVWRQTVTPPKTDTRPSAPAAKNDCDHPLLTLNEGSCLPKGNVGRCDRGTRFDDRKNACVAEEAPPPSPPPSLKSHTELIVFPKFSSAILPLNSGERTKLRKAIRLCNKVRFVIYRKKGKTGKIDDWVKEWPQADRVFVASKSRKLQVWCVNK